MLEKASRSRQAAVRSKDFRAGAKALKAEGTLAITGLSSVLVNSRGRASLEKMFRKRPYSDSSETIGSLFLSLK
jgi:hypothetical protein